MQGIGGPVTEARQEKHVFILSNLSHLVQSIEALEGMAERVSPTPPVPDKEQLMPPKSTPSLAQFLNELPDDLNRLSERVQKATEKLNQSIF